MKLCWTGHFLISVHLIYICRIFQFLFTMAQFQALLWAAHIMPNIEENIWCNSVPIGQGKGSLHCKWGKWAFSSVAQSCLSLEAGHQASLSITISRSLLKLVSIESVMPSNHLILCRPLLLPPSFFHSIRVFSNESVLHISWLKYWSFSFSISPSNEYSGMIFFRMDWLNFLVVQGTLKSLLQYHIQKHQFFGAQLSLYSNSHIHTWLLKKP